MKIKNKKNKNEMMMEIMIYSRINCTKKQIQLFSTENYTRHSYTYVVSLSNAADLKFLNRCSLSLNINL